DYLVAELDEYQNKLKYFNPQAVLLNNIEYDHPDFFPSKTDYKQAFIEFIKKIPKRGFLVANYDDPCVRKIAQVNCRGKVITYAINESADFTAYNIKQHNNQQYFKVKMAGENDQEAKLKDMELGDFSINLLGKHNLSNALAVIAFCVEFNIDLWKIRQYLGEFKGAARRMQVLGEFKGAVIIDDYAHHPTEISASLAAARETYQNNKIITVFHPHTYSRTKSLLEDFAKSFVDSDEIIILDIYGSARENQGGVHSNDLVKKIKSNNYMPDSNIHYIPTLKACEQYLRKNTAKNDIVILMGAGNVFEIGENLIK
ncbi:MAG: Mur ligase family protein, partial [Patescibacteria group bacterium]|nr:Mur ligase family protein [Patescibacteria group bacterium]